MDIISKTVNDGIISTAQFASFSTSSYFNSITFPIEYTKKVVEVLLNDCNISCMDAKFKNKILTNLKISMLSDTNEPLNSQIITTNFINNKGQMVIFQMCLSRESSNKLRYSSKLITTDFVPAKPWVVLIDYDTDKLGNKDFHTRVEFLEPVVTPDHILGATELIKCMFGELSSVKKIEQ